MSLTVIGCTSAVAFLLQLWSISLCPLNPANLSFLALGLGRVVWRRRSIATEAQREAVTFKEVRTIPATYISNLSGHFRGLEDQKPVRPRAFLTHFIRHSWHGYEHTTSRWTGFLVYTQSQASDTSLVSHFFGPCSLPHISLL